MQVQLIVAGEHRNGQVIPVNVPSFMIGQAEGCNIRSRSPQVSRFHCSIAINNNTVTLQDLGGENGTFVNGNRVQAAQTLKDGDKLVVGTHSFVVSIKSGASQAESGGAGANQEDFFELNSSSVLQADAQQNKAASSLDNNKVAVPPQNAKKPSQEAEIMFEIRLDGQRVSVTKTRLFDLARRGSVLSDDLVTVAGTKVFADSIQGIVFGSPTSPASASSITPPRPTNQTPPSSAIRTPTIQTPSVQTPAALESDPFAFPDLGGGAVGSSPFDNITSEPLVRIARKRESAFGAVWNALDISFSRVYTMEGNNLAIHSLKALYYVIIVGAVLVIGFFWSDVGMKCYDAHEKVGNAWQVFSSHIVGLAVVTFGCLALIVIVRILLEMLLQAWMESTRAE